VKPTLRWGVTIAGFTLCGLGIGTGASAATLASHQAAPVGVFRAQQLIPGDTLTGTIAVPAASTALDPYLQALHLVDGGPAGPQLSSLVQLVVRAPNGSSWTGTPADLLTAVKLPGGQLAAHSSRTYAVSLTLPSAATKAYAGRTLGFDMEWGGMDSAGAPVTAVLGETFTRGSAGSGSSSGLGGSLPFTGGDVSLEVAAALVLLVAGSAFVVVGRRNRSTD
jgi:hypothetical protein